MQFLTAEETPEEPPPVTDSATLKHFAREAEVTAIVWWHLSLMHIPSAHLEMVRGSRVLFRTALTSVEPRFNEPLHKEVLGITNYVLQIGLLKCMEKNLDITNQFP